MKQKIVILAMFVALFLTLSGCAEGVSSAPSTPRTNIVLKSGGGFFDSPSYCGFTLPHRSYRIRITHFASDLPTDKIRHSILILSENGDEPNELARIDLYDNPTSLSPREWALKHLSWLMDERATIKKTHMGKESLSTLLIHTPRSPQSYASDTVVLSNGKKIAVVSGSNLNTKERKEAFQKLLETLYF